MALRNTTTSWGSLARLLHWLIFLLVNWDVIFGRIVFDDWLGDTPSMKLFRLGWIHTSIWVSIGARLACAAGVAYVLRRFT